MYSTIYASPNAMTSPSPTAGTTGNAAMETNASPLPLPPPPPPPPPQQRPPQYNPYLPQQQQQPMMLSPHQSSVASGGSSGGGSGAGGPNPGAGVGRRPPPPLDELSPEAVDGIIHDVRIDRKKLSLGEILMEGNKNTVYFVKRRCVHVFLLV